MYEKRVLIVALVCALGFGGLVPSMVAPARAGGMLVGTHMGFTHFSPEDDDGLSVFAFPAQASFFGTFQPGLRIGGFLDDTGRHEIFVDSGVMLLSSDGRSINIFQLMGGYQHFFGTGDLSPFVDVGVGILHLGDDDDSINAMVVGGGLGVRRTLAHGHGAVRAELHVDHQFEGKDNGAVAIEAINAFGLKLGFDLYLK